MIRSGERFLNPAVDARKFLSAATEYEDGVDMVYRLANAQEYGMQRLRDALMGDTSVDFLNAIVHPFIERLGSDDLCIGTCKQAVEQLLDVAYETPGFITNLRAKIEADRAIDEPTPFAWLILSVAGRRKDARDNADVRAITDALTAQNVAIAQRLQTVLDDGCIDASGSLSDERDVPGWRHTNDHVRYRDIKIIPTIDEILSEHEPFLPVPSHPTGPVPPLSGDAGALAHSNATKIATHLDRQFRLLRQDFMSPLREELDQLRGFNAGEGGRPPRFTFHGISLIGIETKPRPCILVRFFLPPGHGALRGSKNDQINFWKEHRGILSQDALCVLAVGGVAQRFATVVLREPERLQQSIVGLSFESTGLDDMSTLLSKCGPYKVFKKAALVQISAGLFQYKPVLRCLQNMDTIPLAEELVLGQPSLPTTYLDLPLALRELDKFQYDPHQLEAMKLALNSRISITQGPPGTGKSFMGVRLADIIYKLTTERILCVCFTNHALDDFLESLLDQGITSMVRIGSRCNSTRLEPYQLFNLTKQAGGGHNVSERRRFAQLMQRKDELETKLGRLANVKTTIGEKWWERKVDGFLFDHDRHAWLQLCVLPEDKTDEDGFSVVFNNQPLTGDALWKRWLKGLPRGPSAKSTPQQCLIDRLLISPHGMQARANHAASATSSSSHPTNIWALSKEDRHALKEAWELVIFQDVREEIAEAMVEVDRVQLSLRELRRNSDHAALRNARVIGCTTTGAANFKELIETARAGVVLVEEAGEILEAHVLTSLQASTKHLIMIGDHKQLRPKLESYELSVSSHSGHDFNRSLFERLVLANAVDYGTLRVQHRMHPDIANHIRPTYENALTDHEKTTRHPPVLGVKSRVVFISHRMPEGGNAAWKVEAMSKTNEYEVGMISAIVNYLVQQGYDSEQLVVLTPYLGQLQLLRKAMSVNWDVKVGDSDFAELISMAGNAGVDNSNPTEPKRAERKPVRVATIDNYQGEEADIVLISLVRSNQEGSIGFLREPERVNVLLSRARHGEIIIGNDQTLRNAKNRAGAAMWNRILDKMTADSHVYTGLPAACHIHNSPAAELLNTPEAFERATPCGGCMLLCNATLDCGHSCPLQCHPFDREHKRVKCGMRISAWCPEGHLMYTKCGFPATMAACDVCNELKKLERQASAKMEELRKVERRVIAEAAANRKKAELRVANAKETIDSLERKRVAKLQQFKSELEEERMRREAEIAAAAADDEDEMAALDARIKADQAAAEKEKAAILASEQRAQKLEEQRRRVQQETSEELSRTDEWVQRELQQITNERSAANDRKQEGQARAESRATSSRSSAEEIVTLRESISAAATQSRSAVRDAVHRGAQRALAQLIRNKELAAVIFSNILNEDQTYTFPAACARGVILFEQSKFMEAYKAFEGSVTRPQTRSQAEVEPAAPVPEARLLATLCKMILDTLDDSCKTTIEQLDSGALELDKPLLGLGYLVKAKALDLAKSTDKERTKRCERAASVYGLALAFVVSPLAKQLTKCSELALELIQANMELIRPDAILKPLGPSPEEAAAARMTAKADTPATKKLLELTGIAPVKKAMFNLRDRVALSIERGDDLKKENYHTIFTGNPGTGKTTVARLFGQVLKEVSVLPNDTFEETSGAKLLAGGVAALNGLLEALKDGGVLFIDEAYQLQPKSNPSGGQVLDLLLTEMEDRRGSLVVVLAGYQKPLEELMAYNDGLPSRFPHKYDFPDFDESELLKILDDNINDPSRSLRFKVEDQKHVRIAARRLAHQRGIQGFGNARAVRNLWESMQRSQSVRIIAEREAGGMPDPLLLVREDLLGPRDVKLASRDALEDLQQMRGLELVKANVDSLLQLTQTNAELEEQEKPTQQVTLNRVFLGNPGTGKTTVAEIYGRILKALGLLSKGEVMVKNPSDFVGSALGQSEERTKTILHAAKGCVLVIDEAYGLHVKDNTTDPYKTAVIDTIVAEVQGVPGDDRCVLLLGYPDQMKEMMRNANPGLARRFQIERAFVFEDYNDKDLCHILKAKARKMGWELEFDALQAAVGVLAKERMKPNFGNGGAVANLLSEAVTRFEWRMSQSNVSSADRAADRTLTAIDFDADASTAGDELYREEKIEEVFADLVSSDAIVQELREVQATVAYAEKRGKDPLTVAPLAFIFVGPPGTGKTKVARKMGTLYKLLGLLPTDEIVQCGVTDLVGEYVGKTGPKTRAKFEEALGKVLVVDEAYRLDPQRGGTFNQEAVDEMVNILTEEQFQGKLLLILAGYEAEMEAMLQGNAGLKSRVPNKIKFERFSVDDSIKLLRQDLKEAHGLDVASDAIDSLPTMAEELVSLPNFASGRDVITWSLKIYRQVAIMSRLATSSSADLDVASFQAIRVALDAILQSNQQPLPQSSPLITRSESIPLCEECEQSPLVLAPPPPVVQKAVEVEEDWVEVEDGNGDDDASIMAALQMAVVKLGYDATHEKRIELRDLLRATEADGKFPADIMDAVKAQVGGKPETKIDTVLRPQLPPVIASFHSAIEQEIAHRAEIARLEAEMKAAEAAELRKQEAQAQEKLQAMGICPAGFSWHREGCGWRCNGGAHYVESF